MKKSIIFILALILILNFAKPVTAVIDLTDDGLLLPENDLSAPFLTSSFYTPDQNILHTDAIYEITVSAGENGSISPSSATVNQGDSQTFTIIPDTGYEIEDVKIDGISVGAVSTYTFTDVTSNHTISSTFKIRTFLIRVISSFGGSTSPFSAYVDYGGSQTFTITPSNGYEIYSIKVDGIVTGSTASTYTFTNVTADHTISVSYLLLTYGIYASAGAGGSINPGFVTVIYNASQTFTITPNTGYEIDDVTVDGISQGAIDSYTFSNVKEIHSISATFKKKIFTITASAGENGNISPASATVTYGDDQTFTVTPDTGFTVNDIKVDGVSVGAANSYTFTGVAASHTIDATFKTATYEITATAGDHGSISPASATVSHGESQTFTITPDSDYEIKDVTVDGVSQGAVSSYTFSDVTASHTIAAAFKPAMPTNFSITTSAGENGSISPAFATVNYGDDQSFAITPNTGFNVDDVKIDGVSLGAVTSYSFRNVTADHTIEATFKTATYEITATAGDHGSISPTSTTVSYGESQTFTITPDSDYEIKEVTVDGVSQGGVSSYTFNDVTSSHTITATFKPVVPTNFSIFTSAGENGSIIPFIATVSYGDDQTFTITPNIGFDVDDVKIDGVSVGNVTSYTFTDVTSNHAIAATFKPAVYTLRAETTSHGSISPSSTTAAYGDERTFTITPDTGYEIEDVKIDGISAGAISSYVFTNVKANHTITAIFMKQTFAVTVNADSHGSIDPAAASVEYGSDQTFTITPDTGYEIKDVLVDGTSVGAVDSYTFKNVTATHSISATFKKIAFAISVTAGDYGKISPSSSTVAYGDNQTFTITPNTGYEIKDVFIDGTSVGAIDSYTFKNVTATHTLSATFKQKSTQAFNDVPNNIWYKDSVDDLVSKGILSGYKNNDNSYSFKPDNTITRVEFATILAKASGEDLSSYENKTSFHDVSTSFWGAKYIEWAYQNNIVKGKDGGKYDPDANISRQEMAVMIYRFATVYQGNTLPQNNTALSFTDQSSIATWAKDAVTAMQRANIINGMENTNGSFRFEPNGKATRAQAAKMISTYLGL